MSATIFSFFLSKGYVDVFPVFLNARGGSIRELNGDEKNTIKINFTKIK